MCVRHKSSIDLFSTFSIQNPIINFHKNKRVQYLIYVHESSETTEYYFYQSLQTYHIYVVRLKVDRKLAKTESIHKYIKYTYNRIVNIRPVYFTSG